MRILSALVAVTMTGIWIAYARHMRAETRRRLGADVREIVTASRWTRRFSRALGAFAVFAPVITAALWLLRDLSPGILFEGLLQSMWAGSMGYELQCNGVLLCGRDGFAIGAGRIVPWTDVQHVRWDRDIGQLEWGFTVAVSKGRSVEHRRIFIRRERRAEVAELFDRYVVGAPVARLQPAHA